MSRPTGPLATRRNHQYGQTAWPVTGSTCISSRCPTTSLGPGAHGPGVGQKWELEEDASSPFHRTTGSGKKGRGDPGIGLPGTQPSAGQPACPRMKERAPQSPSPASRVHLCPFRPGNPLLPPHHPCPLCPAPRWRAGEALPCALTPPRARVLGGAPGRDAADTLLPGTHGTRRRAPGPRAGTTALSPETLRQRGKCPHGPVSTAPPSTERAAGPAHAPTGTGPGGPGARPAQWEKPNATGRGTRVHGPAAARSGERLGCGVPS